MRETFRRRQIEREDRYQMQQNPAKSDAYDPPKGGLTGISWLFTFGTVNFWLVGSQPSHLRPFL
jgi:hypothetical protein